MQLETLRTRAPRRIGLTPLIDVVFILLLFFLLASRLQSLQALDLANPSPPAAQSARSEGPAVLVRVHEHGDVDLNGRPLPVAALQTALAERLASNPGLAVFVAADDAVRLQALVAVLDQVTAAGVTELRLQ